MQPIYHIFAFLLRGLSGTRGVASSPSKFVLLFFCAVCYSVLSDPHYFVGKNGFLECLQLLLEKGYHVDCPTVRAHFLNHKKTIAAFTVYSCNRKGWRKKDSFNICCAWKSL